MRGSAAIRERIELLAGAAQVWCLAGLLGTSAAAALPRIEAADVFELEYAIDPRISPDGGSVVFIREIPDVASDQWFSNLWIVPTGGGPARPLTPGSHHDGTPRFSPDGRQLAFLSDRDGSVQIYVLRLEDRQVRRLTSFDRSPSGLAWSPDGRHIAFTALEPRPPPAIAELPRPPQGAQWAEPPLVTDRLVYRADGRGYLENGFYRLWVVPAAGGKPRRVTRDDSPYHEVSYDPWNMERDAAAAVWTPDSKSLLISARRRDDWELEPYDTEIYELSLEEGTLRALTSRFGPDASPTVSPDGRWIAYVGFDDRRKGFQVARLYLMPRRGGASRVLTATLDRSVRGPRWAGDSRSLLVRYNDQGDTKIARVDLEGRLTVLGGSVGDGYSSYAGGSFTVARNGTYAFTYSRPDMPIEVAVASVDDPTPRLLSDLNGDFLAKRRLGRVEEIRFESARGGRSIQGWIVYPPDFDPRRRYPLILDIHGGPFRDYGARFDLEKQVWAARGYVVLYVNQRGSTGYGEAFANLIHHDYPGDDLHDLNAAVETILERGYVDPRNLFVTGGSGGALLSLWMISHSHRFRAAVASYPLVNWTSFMLTTDISARVAYYWFPGPPWEHPEQYFERSALFRAGQVETPTMLIVGEEDYRTPASEAEQFYTVLKHRGIEAVLVRFPDEPHFAERYPSHLMSRMLLTLGWFDRHRAEADDAKP